MSELEEQTQCRLIRKHSRRVSHRLGRRGVRLRVGVGGALRLERARHAEAAARPGRHLGGAGLRGADLEVGVLEAGQRLDAARQQAVHTRCVPVQHGDKRFAPMGPKNSHREDRA